VIRAGLLALLALGLAGCAQGVRPRSPASVEGASDPYVVVLGTAQDGGLPHAACTCPHCEAARREPALRRRVASIAVVVPMSGRRYLIDATPDLREQLDLLPAVGTHAAGAVDRRPVDGVLLTHAHIGHYLGLAFFGFEAVHTSRLPVYTTPRLAAFLRTNGPWNRLVSRDEIDLIEAPAGRSLALDAGVRVTPFSVPHRDEDSDTVGFKIEGPRHAIVYVPDTDAWETWNADAEAALAACDTALVDGTFYSAAELPGRDVRSIGHPLMVATMERWGASVRSGTLRVLFTHLNHSNGALDPNGPERRAILERGFGIASDGQRLPL